MDLNLLVRSCICARGRIWNFVVPPAKPFTDRVLTRRHVRSGEETGHLLSFTMFFGGKKRLFEAGINLAQFPEDQNEENRDHELARIGQSCFGSFSCQGIVNAQAFH